MIGATWNVRGLNKRGKIQCITDLINDNKLDFVGFQETKKDEFSDALLSQVHKDFSWQLLPAVGTAGGILVGFSNKQFEMIACRKTNSCVSVLFKNSVDKFV
jgi:exonuclease III